MIEISEMELAFRFKTMIACKNSLEENCGVECDS